MTDPLTENARLRAALELAANRLLRCAVDYDAGTRRFIETGEWANEARAALATPAPDAPVAMRPETEAEHLARDMREGRFPDQSERKMVPVVPAPDAVFMMACSCGLGGPCMWSECKHPLRAIASNPKG